MNTYHETQLAWPPQKQFCQDRKPGQFQSSLANALDRVESQVSAFTKKGSKWRTRELWIYLDGGKLGVKGKFLANVLPLSPAVVVTFDLDETPYTIAVDRYTHPAQNLCAIAATIEGLRAQERHGVLTMKEMLSTFAELPAKSSAKVRGWWDVLNIPKSASKTEAEVAYRHLVKSRHPDVGGTAQEWLELREAYETAQEVCK